MVINASVFPSISSILVEARCVGNVVTDLVVPCQKLRCVVFSRVFQVGNETIVAIIGHDGMAFPCTVVAGLVSDFVDDA
jgi:hypothetical protein